MTSRRTGLVILLAGVCLLLAITPLLASRNQPIEESPLPVLWDIPAFELTGAGGPFHSDALAGKVWVVDFFLTSCEGACPVMTANMKTLYTRYEDDPRVAFVSITTDPETDTPEVLAAYAERYEADPARWHFLTGPEAELHRLMGEVFKVGVPENPMAHSQRFMIVDQQRRLRSLYSGVEDQSIPLIVADINTLLADEAS